MKTLKTLQRKFQRIRLSHRNRLTACHSRLTIHPNILKMLSPADRRTLIYKADPLDPYQI